jgi:hypothetical protein
MPTLLELQTGFLEAILDASPARVSDAIVADGRQAARRLAVYANNSEAGYLAALRASFPAIHRLVGDDCFTQCAREFRRGNPSRCGDLHPAGAAFPSYWAARHAEDRFRYLGDVARLEWLYQESQTAGEHAALDVLRLAAVPADAYDDLLFHLHPSARLFASPFPAVAIWEANVGSDAEPQIIDLDRGGDRVLMVRSGNGVTFRPLGIGAYVFLEAIARGRPFAAAIADAADGDPGFDAAAALPALVQLGAIVDFSVAAALP